MIEITEIYKEGEYGASYEVAVKREGKEIIGFSAHPLQECSEDASLERDLYYAYSAVDFFKIGYEAGKSGETVVFNEENEDEEEND